MVPNGQEDNTQRMGAGGMADAPTPQTTLLPVEWWWPEFLAEDTGFRELLP